MKQLRIIIIMLAMLAASSCTKQQSSGEGYATFVLTGDYEIAERTRSNVSQYTSLPSSGDFTISIADASQNHIWTGSLSEWDAATKLKAGSYTATASYGTIEEEGFDKPFFTGSQDFTITGGETYAVEITATLGNTVILVACTDSFRNYYKDYTFSITRNGSTIATFVKDETKAAFVDGYRFTIEGTLTSETRTQTFTKDYTSLDEATAYTILFDTSNIGSSSITIKFDEKAETVDLGDLELNE